MTGGQQAAIVVSVALILTAIVGQTCRAQVISEIMPRPVEDTGEWIEIINATAITKDMRGWSLLDAAEHTATLKDGDLMLAPGGYLIVAEDTATITALDLPPDVGRMVPRDWTPLTNDGDTLSLIDPARGVIDKIAYTSQATTVAGRSWERLDPGGSGLDPDNWGYCGEFSGNTAGAPNSLTAAEPSGGVKITADPNPFSPDGDGVDEVTSISFVQPPGSYRITIDVYNLHGQPVRRLASDLPAGSASPVLQWDGRSDRGAMLPTGRYVIVLESLNYARGRTFVARCTVVLACRLH